MLTWILAGLLGIGLALLLVAALVHFISQDAERLKRINSRFRGAMQNLEQNTEASAETILKHKVSATNPITMRLSRNAGKQLFLLGSHWFSSFKQAFYFTSATSGIAFFAWILFSIPILISFLCAIFIFLTLNIFLRNRQSRKRKELIEEKVPEVMEMIVRSLRVGTPISSALTFVGRDLSGPLAEEFVLVSQEISYGKDMNTALREMAERCDNQDLHFFATAVSIQVETGGNLAEVIARLAHITRGRFQLKRKISAITGEARWSGNFLSAFPILACLALLSVNPDYFNNIIDEPYFFWILVAAGALMAINILFMRYMVNLSD